MSPTLRKTVLAAVGGGALAIASALITGPMGNDGLECDTPLIRMW